MTTLREAAQMALDAYESRMQQIGGCSDGGCVVVKPKGMHTNGGCKCWKNERSMQRLAMAANSLTKALRAALAQAEQEPVAQVDYNERNNIRWLFGPQVPDKALLYRAPPQREWQGLTDEERQEYLFCDPVFGMAASSLVRVIEAKLKEKNT